MVEQTPVPTTDQPHGQLSTMEAATSTRITSAISEFLVEISHHAGSGITTQEASVACDLSQTAWMTLVPFRHEFRKENTSLFKSFRDQLQMVVTRVDQLATDKNMHLVDPEEVAKNLYYHSQMSRWVRYLSVLLDGKEVPPEELLSRN